MCKKQVHLAPQLPPGPPPAAPKGIKIFKKRPKAKKDILALPPGPPPKKLAPKAKGIAGWFGNWFGGKVTPPIDEVKNPFDGYGRAPSFTDEESPFAGYGATTSAIDEEDSPFAGYDGRPGYLSGVFSNWDQVG
jgi:hypothetical protein